MEIARNEKKAVGSLTKKWKSSNLCSFGRSCFILHDPRKPGQTIDASQPLLCASSKPGPLGKWSTTRSSLRGISSPSYLSSLSFQMANCEGFGMKWKKTSDPLPRLSPTRRALPCLKDSMSFTKCRWILILHMGVSISGGTPNGWFINGNYHWNGWWLGAHHFQAASIY